MGGIMWAMFVPVIYALAASPAISLFGQRSVDSRAWGTMFVLMPLALLAGLVITFWATNGFKTLMFVRRYELSTVPVAAGAAGAAAVAMETAGDLDDNAIAETASTVDLDISA
jgi:hypothetical protein